jgi:hypothetical protein
VTTDPLLLRVMAAIADNSDSAEGKRLRFQALWDEIGASGDALHRCILAHYVADLFEDPAVSLLWNQRSLDAAGELSDARLQAALPGQTVAGFLPSLHLNLAQDHERLGDPAAARRHLNEARSQFSALPEDGYGAMIRRGVVRVEAWLAGAPG